MIAAVWRCSSSRRLVSRTRCFSTTRSRREIRSIDQLPDRVCPRYQENSSSNDLLTLQWPAPLRNVLFVCKDDSPTVTAALLEYVNHIHTTYPAVSLIFEHKTAIQLHQDLPFPVYVQDNIASYNEKVDLTSTLGGDGTILHAASLFATSKSVPPILSFSMGTLGFLGEWKFPEYKRAFREVYVSGAPGPVTPALDAPVAQSDSASPSDSVAWAAPRGKSMGSSRHSRILLRNRLRVGLFTASGERLPPTTDTYALNEVLLHRGAAPHLSHITIAIGAPPHQRTLTTAIADGFLVSTPTGSTAYSLSSGGSIVHPLVSSLLLTPICPRSLSFRPLVLPANTHISLRIDAANRGKEIEVSVDGVRRLEGLKAGMEVRVVGEEVRTAGAPGAREWYGGVPSVVRSGGGEGQDHWVGGLNSLLKFNYPFGEDG